MMAALHRSRLITCLKPNNCRCDPNLDVIELSIFCFGSDVDRLMTAVRDNHS